MTSQTGFWHTSRRAFAVVLSAFMLLPIVVVLIASFTNDSYVKFPPDSYGLRWYGEVFMNDAFRGGLVFSLQIATTVALASGVFGVLAALALTRWNFFGRDAIVTVLMTPIALPHIVLAIALLQLVGMIGLPSSPYALMAGHMLITVPYVLRLTMASLVGRDQNIERASQSLGASPWQTARFVTLPMIAPGMVAGIVFAFLTSFDESTIALFTSLPGNTTLPAQIFGYATQGSDPIITAASGVMIIFAAVLVLVVEKFFGVLRLMANEPK